MGQPVAHTWRGTRVPCRVVERIYGSGNFDDAGDDLIYALRRVADAPDLYRYRFSFDSSHPNPWYHTMVFEVEDLPDSVYGRFVEEVAALGLAEVSGTA